MKRNFAIVLRFKAAARKLEEIGNFWDLLKFLNIDLIRAYEDDYFFKIDEDEPLKLEDLQKLHYLPNFKIRCEILLDDDNYTHRLVINDEIECFFNTCVNN